jgi:putative drug exporter of the RND superfamily
MVFRFLGQVIRRAWPLVLIAWGGLLLAGRWVAPDWRKVAQEKEFAFLPANSPSLRAEEIFKKAFPDQRLGSNIVLLLVDQQPQHLDRNHQFIQDVLEPDLRKIAREEGGLASEAPPPEGKLFGDEPEGGQQDTGKAETTASAPEPIVNSIRTPNAPGRGALLVSPDRQALLVVVELTTDFLTLRNWPLIKRIRESIEQLRQQGKVPAGLDIFLTGSAVLGQEHTQAEYDSARATTWLTIILVVVLLILIYRAPLLAAIPLVTVYLAVRGAIDILAVLASHGYVTVFQGLEVYITILAYGAGVDYCLFLTSRYKEELDHGARPGDAIAAAVAGVGAALTASAATVICGIFMMYFAEFGKFREAGLAISLSIFLVLLVTLTFSPALLCLAGRWAFWPQHPEPGGGEPRPQTQRPRSRFASAIRPVVMVLRAGELHDLYEHGGRILRRRPGLIWLATFLFLTPWVVLAGIFYNRLNYDIVSELPSNAAGVHATRLLQQHFPEGTVGPVTVLLVNKQENFSSPQGQALVRRIVDQLRAGKEQLDLADILSLATPLGIGQAAEQGSEGLHVSEKLRQETLERQAIANYTTSLGERNNVGTRLDLILTDSPFSRRSIEDLDRIQQDILTALPEQLRSNTQLYFLGTTPSVRDLADVLQRDRERIQILVLVSVFVILVLLLRRLVVPLYLLASVLFSYYVTLGVSFVAFWLVQGSVGLDWEVAVFLFTILIAVGEDYNIFLLTRVHEEQRQHGPILGITEALTRTGPIISSCGIIMAGTFASLLAGSLTQMKQLGFALAFGVLLDTFIVRPILVPAFLLLLNSGRLRPSAWIGKPKPDTIGSAGSRQTSPAP